MKEKNIEKEKSYSDLSTEELNTLESKMKEKIDSIIIISNFSTKERDELIDTVLEYREILNTLENRTKN